MSEIETITIEELIEQGYNETNNEVNGMPILKSDYKRMIVEPQQDGSYKVVCRYSFTDTLYHTKRGSTKPLLVNENIQGGRY